MGGMTEIVTDGVDGLLFDAGNVDQLSDALNLDGISSATGC